MQISFHSLIISSNMMHVSYVPIFTNTGSPLLLSFVWRRVGADELD